MKKYLTPVLLSILIVGLLLILTKPTRLDFVNYLSADAEKKIFGRALQKEYADDIIDTGFNQSVAKEMVSSMQYKDHLFYTTVTSKIKGHSHPLRSQPLGEIKYIGILGFWFAKPDIFKIISDASKLKREKEKDEVESDVILYEGPLGDPRNDPYAMPPDGDQHRQQTQE